MNVSTHHPTTTRFDYGGKLVGPDLAIPLFCREQTDDYDISAVERVIEAPVLLHADMMAVTTTRSYRFLVGCRQSALPQEQVENGWMNPSRSHAVELGR